MSWEDIARKFADCAAAAIDPWPTDRIQRAIVMARTLEEQDDATELLRLL
jgi:hypothetical protein